MLVDELKEQYMNTSVFEDNDILILDDFLENWKNVKRFNEKYYNGSYPKTVLCGINPGKKGAGKTGVPFIDFLSLSKLLDNVERVDTERSAAFFYDIVQEFGAEQFYKSFYVTNISWLGFINDGKNLNYYKLSDQAKEFIHKMFLYEMNEVSPTTIISLSGEVKKTISSLFNAATVDITKTLPHPNYCAFPKNYDACKRKYIEMLSPYIVTELKHTQVFGDASLQNSDAWFEWRKQFRTASQASTVLGINPFESTEQMKQRELSLTPKIESNSAMRTGVEREDEVRKKAEAHFMKTFTPQCWEYGKYGASLDGIDDDGKIVVELKVSKYTYFQLKKGEIPENYKTQVMQQLMCSGADTGYVIAMNPETDDIAVSSPIELESDFYSKLEKAWLTYDNLVF